MKRVIIMMPLLDEGTDVWVGVPAEALDGDLYRVLGVMPSDQNWRFPPGSVVALRERVFSSGNVGLEAIEVTG